MEMQGLDEEVTMLCCKEHDAMACAMARGNTNIVVAMMGVKTQLGFE
jgi:hypothetical protein